MTIPLRELRIYCKRLARDTEHLERPDDLTEDSIETVEERVAALMMVHAWESLDALDPDNPDSSEPPRWIGLAVNERGSVDWKREFLK